MLHTKFHNIFGSISGLCSWCLCTHLPIPHCSDSYSTGCGRASFPSLLFQVFWLFLRVIFFWLTHTHWSWCAFLWVWTNAWTCVSSHHSQSLQSSLPLHLCRQLPHPPTHPGLPLISVPSLYLCLFVGLFSYIHTGVSLSTFSLKLFLWWVLVVY